MQRTVTFSANFLQNQHLQLSKLLDMLKQVPPLPHINQAKNHIAIQNYQLQFKYNSMLVKQITSLLIQSINHIIDPTYLPDNIKNILIELCLNVPDQLLFYINDEPLEDRRGAHMNSKIIYEFLLRLIAKSAITLNSWTEFQDCFIHYAGEVSKSEEHYFSDQETLSLVARHQFSIIWNYLHIHNHLIKPYETWLRDFAEAYFKLLINIIAKGLNITDQSSIGIALKIMPTLITYRRCVLNDPDDFNFAASDKNYTYCYLQDQGEHTLRMLFLNPTKSIKSIADLMLTLDDINPKICLYAKSSLTLFRLETDIDVELAANQLELMRNTFKANTSELTNGNVMPRAT